MGVQQDSDTSRSGLSNVQQLVRFGILETKSTATAPLCSGPKSSVKDAFIFSELLLGEERPGGRQKQIKQRSEQAGQRGQMWCLPSLCPAWTSALRNHSEPPSLLMVVAFKRGYGAGVPQIVLLDLAPGFCALVAGRERRKRENPFWSRSEKEKMRALM